ncbi:Rep [Chicken proventriculitis-associated circular virus 15]|nr:Rep [Chicken proventriculitis-associated circular virus 15]
MPNYAPRVSMPYMDISGIIILWSKSCESIIVYEHESDEEVKTTHVHLLMINSEYATPEPLKRLFYKNLSTDRKGNDLWAWTHETVPDLTFITYMSKGILAPKFINNISTQEVEKARLNWKQSGAVPKTNDSNKSEFTLLLEAYEKQYKAKLVTCNMSEIKQWIKSRYLSQRKAIPRGSDTNRYAYSIYAIVMGLDVDTADRHAMTAGIDIN